MKYKKLGIAIASLSTVFPTASIYAADIEISGYASFFGGRALNQGTLTNGESASQVIDPVNATNGNELNPRAYYFDEFTFDPDSNFGLQVRANLADGLTFTGLVSGRGSISFDAEIDWAYLSYDLNNAVTVDFGRKRLPLYYYSDFIDVGYAYNWIRPPVDVYTLPLNSYNGIALRANQVLGSWEVSGQLFAGTGGEENSLLGNLTLTSIAGTELRFVRDWLELRFAIAETEFYTEGTTTDADNPVNVRFSSFSLNAEFDRFYFLAEYAEFMTDDYVQTGPSISTASTPSYYVTTGYRFGDFTPHITFSALDIEMTGDLNPIFDGVSQGSESFIAGLRWDFNSSAAFKIEYSIQNDTSDEIFQNLAGQVNELDIFSLGVDLIF